MKVFYINSEGLALVDDMKPNKRLIEMKGGDYHPFAAGGVWKDEKKRQPAMMFYWQTIRWPEGAGKSDGSFPALEANLTKQHMQAVSVSKAFWRGAVKWLWVFGKLMILGFVMVFMVFIISLILSVGA